MNRIEHYHDWLRDAHAMEKQAESMLESMASRIDNYPELRARIEQHLSETKNHVQAWEVFEKLEDCYFSQKQPPAAQPPPQPKMMDTHY